MKIATWNVNSLKVRLPHVLRWLLANRPEVLFLQELKGTQFPAAELAELGYTAEIVAQKTYNGVATLARIPMRRGIDRLPGNDGDEQARYLEVEAGGLHLINLYLPNGNPPETEKFSYKLAWMDRLIARLAQLRKDAVPFLVGGDFNVIPEDRDCYDPDLWRGDALFHPETLRRFRALLNLGLVDAFRIGNLPGGQYTFWDYQAGAWPRNNGIRIDHFLLSPPLADRFVSARIDRDERGKEQPSDHVPLILELSGNRELRG